MLIPSVYESSEIRWHCINSLLFRFPAVNGVGLGGEVDAEFDDLLAGGKERLVIALFLYLLESDFR